MWFGYFPPSLLKTINIFCVLCPQSQFLLSLQAISIMVHFYMGTKGPENVSLHTAYISQLIYLQ